MSGTCPDRPLHTRLFGSYLQDISIWHFSHRREEYEGVLLGRVKRTLRRILGWIHLGLTRWTFRWRPRRRRRHGSQGRHADWFFSSGDGEKVGLWKSRGGRWRWVVREGKRQEERDGRKEKGGKKDVKSDHSYILGARVKRTLRWAVPYSIGRLFY